MTSAEDVLHRGVKRVAEPSKVARPSDGVGGPGSASGQGEECAAAPGAPLVADMVDAHFLALQHVATAQAAVEAAKVRRRQVAAAWSRVAVGHDQLRMYTSQGMCEDLVRKAQAELARCIRALNFTTTTLVIYGHLVGRPVTMADLDGRRMTESEVREWVLGLQSSKRRRYTAEHCGAANGSRCAQGERDEPSDASIVVASAAATPRPLVVDPRTILQQSSGAAAAASRSTFCAVRVVATKKPAVPTLPGMPSSKAPKSILKPKEKQVLRQQLNDALLALPPWVAWGVTRVRTLLNVHDHGWMTLHVDQYRCSECGERLSDANKATAVCPRCRIGNSGALFVTSDMLQPDSAGREQQRSVRAKPSMRSGYRPDSRTMSAMRNNLNNQKTVVEVPPEVMEKLCGYLRAADCVTKERYQRLPPAVTRKLLVRAGIELSIEAGKVVSVDHLLKNVRAVHTQLTGTAPHPMEPILENEIGHMTQRMQDIFARKDAEERLHAARDTEDSCGRQNRPPGATLLDSLFVCRGVGWIYVPWNPKPKRPAHMKKVHAKLEGCYTASRIPYEPVREGLNHIYVQMLNCVEAVEAHLQPTLPQLKKQLAEVLATDKAHMVADGARVTADAAAAAAVANATADEGAVPRKAKRTRVVVSPIVGSPTSDASGTVPKAKRVRVGADELPQDVRV